MSQSKVVNSSAVRQFFTDNPGLVPEGDKTVGTPPEIGFRGRVSAKAKQIFAEKNPNTVFAEGKSAPKNAATQTLTYQHRQPSGRTVKKTVDLPLSEIRSLAGDAAATRGRLTPAALEAAGNAYAKQVARNAKKVQKAAQPKPVVEES